MSEENKQEDYDLLMERLNAALVDNRLLRQQNGSLIKMLTNEKKMSKVFHDEVLRLKGTI